MKKVSIIAVLVLAGAFVFADTAATTTAAQPATPAATTTTTTTTTTAVASPANSLSIEGVIVQKIPANKTRKTAATLVVRGADKKALALLVRANVPVTNAEGKKILFSKLAWKEKITVTYAVHGKVAYAETIQVAK